MTLFDALWPWMHLAGRVVFAGALMVLSLGHFTQTDVVAGYAASKGVPAPKVMTLVTGAMAWVGSILIALGWHRFIGAGLVILFLLFVTFWIHRYWGYSDPQARMMDRTQFWKNIAMLGAAIFFAAYAGGLWPKSLGG